MSNWAGLVNTTMKKYFKGEIVAVLRKRLLLSMLEQRGQISFNASGAGDGVADDMQWQVRYLQNDLQGFDDSSVLIFSAVNRHKRAVLPWRGYAMPEGMHEIDRMKNRGPEALVNIWDTKAKDMMSDISEKLGPEMYVDGNAAGNSLKLHGIESFMSVSGALASQKVGNPNDTYAGLSTALAGYGGSWDSSAVWPDGTGSATYDFWSPIVVDYTNALWPQATKTWDNTAVDAMRYGLMAARRNDDKDNMIEIVIHEREMYRKFVTLFQTEERLPIQPGDNTGMRKLGFKDIINFDGTDVTWEFGCPGGVGYGWCMNALEMICLNEELIDVKGPDLDPASQVWRFWATMVLNLKFRTIRNFLKFKAIS